MTKMTNAQPPSALHELSCATTLSDLLYTKRNAADILRGRDISFLNIEAVNVPDPDQIEVCIQYSIQGSPQQVIVPCTEFLALAWGDRMLRSNDYRAVAATPISALVSRTNGGYGSQTYHVWVEANGQVQCSCPDYANQFAVLQEHPALWTLIYQQPRCKHLLAAIGVLERTDLFLMPTVGGGGDSSGGNGGDETGNDGSGGGAGGSGDDSSPVDTDADACASTETGTVLMNAGSVSLGSGAVS